MSEGIRPRLPWAPLLRTFIADPTPTIALLDLLHADESEYVRRSVANHLNDVAKDHPALAVATARRWLDVGGEPSRWVARHGLRTLVKRGDPDALALLGYGPADGVTVPGFTADPTSVSIGDPVTMSCTLVAEQDTPVVIDYAIHHVGAAGIRAAKVFKWTTRALSARQPVTLSRRHHFREVSVRRLYPGPHRIDVQVNGAVLASVEVHLTRPG